MSKKNVFVSFDHTNDKHNMKLLEAWNPKSNFDFVFRDQSSLEIDSSNISAIKTGLKRKIRHADCTIVLIGENATKQHEDFRLIGFTNWISFEVEMSNIYGNKIIAVKLESENIAPDELNESGALWVSIFTESSITEALKII